MKNFVIHFLEKDIRTIKDPSSLATYFAQQKGFGYAAINKGLTANFIFEHPKLGFGCNFYYEQSSRIPDLHRLDASFRDIAFRVEIPLLTPNYVARKILEIVKDLTNKFNLYIYTEFHEDAIKFALEDLLLIFIRAKTYYLERHYEVFEIYHMLPETKLNTILRYIDDIDELRKFYYEDYVCVPDYEILKDENGKLSFGFIWNEGTQTIFPPYIDYVFYKQGNDTKVVKMQEVKKAIGEYLENVPGFLKETSVIYEINIKKASKKMRKYKFEKINKKFTRELLTNVMD